MILVFALVIILVILLYCCMAEREENQVKINQNNPESGARTRFDTLRTNMAKKEIVLNLFLKLKFDSFRNRKRSNLTTISSQALI